MRWQDKLTKRELNHLRREGGCRTLKAAKRLFAQQDKILIESREEGLPPGIAEPCWECLTIARKLGFRQVQYDSGRGGPRKGAGRPKGATSVDPALKRDQITIRLPRWLIEWLRSPIKETEDCVLRASYPGNIIEHALERTFKFQLNKFRPKTEK